MIRHSIYLVKIISLLSILITHKASSQIIISQYYEGIANNKFLEITNVSGATISVENSEFFICLFSNEAASNPQGVKPSLVTAITQTILPGGSMVIKNALAEAPNYAVQLATSGLIGAFNGNDLIIISTSKEEDSWDNRVDVIGNNTLWGVDKSFYRKPAVNDGANTFIDDQWEEVDLSTVNSASAIVTSYLGNHIYDCQIPTTASHSPLIQTVSDTSVGFNWSGGNGSSRIALMSKNEIIDDPLNGLSYDGNATLGLGDMIGNAYVVYSGWDETLSVSNLEPSTTYQIRIIEFSCDLPFYNTSEVLDFEITTLDPIPRLGIDLTNTILDFGIIKPGNSSAAIKTILSWENVNTAISVATSQPFELSLDSIIWSSQLNINPIKTDSNQGIFIRYSPDSPNGNALEALLITTNGAETIELQLEGIAFPNVWINEFHYDNEGADVNEFVEVVLQNDQLYALADLKIQLINGENGLIYDQVNFSNMMKGEKAGNYSIYYASFPTIQNAGPLAGDGFVLAIKNTFIQFISYEGSISASAWPISGKSSVDVGLIETESTPVGHSLQLEEKEFIANDATTLLTNKSFTWTSGEDSPGAFNANQVLPVELAYFIVKEAATGAKLLWKTLSESNNSHFDIQKSSDGFDFKTLFSVAGNGTVTSPIIYQFNDNQFNHSSYFRLKQVDFDGNFSFSKIIFLKKSLVLEKNFTVSPNPFMDEIEIIDRQLPVNKRIQASIFSIQGKKILETRGDLVKIKAQINQHLGKLPTGIYVLELEKDRQREKHKLLKK